MIEWLQDGWGILTVIVAVVVLFNVGLIYSLISGSAAAQWDMVRRIAERSRNPWRQEDRDLQELRQRAERLRQDSEEHVDENE